MRALTAAQMRTVDAAAGARIGELALMANAGRAIAHALLALAPGPRRAIAFAGPGNNGGDAFAALAEVTPDCERIVYALAPPHASAARKDAEARAADAGVRAEPFPVDRAAAQRALQGSDVALDAMLGTGARNDPPPEMQIVLAALRESRVPVLAVDVPTGLDATTGAASGDAVHAGATVALGALKIGQLLEPGRVLTGALYLGDIGILDAEIDAAEGPRFFALTDREFVRALPVRPDDTDKRTAGAPLVVAGSVQFPGAAVLCARGAARAGAGYVTVATSQEAAPAVRSHLVEQVVIGYRSNVDDAIADLLDLTHHASSVAIGPGLGLDEGTGAIVRGFVERLKLPFVADASALFHFAKRLDLLEGKRCVVTPHAREFARLSGEGTIPEGKRVERLRSFVSRTGIVTLLKGSATLIDDGTNIHVNVSGTPALATAGTGDTLTGMIATLLAQGLAPVDAARVGAYWHGLGGQSAAVARPIGVVAGDVSDALGAALRAARTRAASNERLQLIRTS